MSAGFIGLGIMGSRMAMNLLKNGNEVIVYNRTKEKADELIKAGAEWGGSVAGTASKADILFTMLSKPEVVEYVASGEDGILKNMNKGALWVDSSTVNPSFSRRMAKEAGLNGIRFIDAPVAGSMAPAEKGELLFLAGGRNKDIEECRPLLEIMGRGVVHAGDNGMGSSLKMLVNMTMGIAMSAFTEAMQLGRSLGFEKERLMDILLELPVIAPILKGKKDKFLSGNYDAEFPLKWMQKDMHLASLSAYENDIAMPVANAAKELFALAKQKGWADKDFSGVFGFMEDNNAQ